QVEVPLAIALLHVGQPVEGVRKRAPVPGERHDLVREKRRLAAPRFPGAARGADDIAEMDVDRPGATRVADQLDASGRVHEVEEHELPHLPPGHDPPGDAASGITLSPCFELLGLRAHRGDRIAVREPFRSLHRARVYGRSHRNAVDTRLPDATRTREPGAG